MRTYVICRILEAIFDVDARLRRIDRKALPRGDSLLLKRSALRLGHLPSPSGPDDDAA